MNSFTHYMPTHIIMGDDALERFAAVSPRTERAIIVTSQPVYDHARDALHRFMETLETHGVTYTVFDEFEAPLEKADIFRGGKVAREHNADVIIGFGGGRVLDLAKLIARFTHESTETFDAWMLSKEVPPFDQDALPTVMVPTSLNNASAFNPKAFIHDRRNDRRVRFKHVSLFPRAALVSPSFYATLSRVALESAIANLFVRSVELLIAQESVHRTLIAKDALGLLIRSITANEEDHYARLAHVAMRINTQTMRKPLFPLHQINDAIEGVHPTLPFCAFVNNALMPYFNWRIDAMSEKAHSELKEAFANTPYYSNNVYVCIKQFVDSFATTRAPLERHGVEAAQISDYTVHLKTIYPDFNALEDSALYAIMEEVLITSH